MPLVMRSSLTLYGIGRSFHAAWNHWNKRHGPVSRTDVDVATRAEVGRIRVATLWLTVF